MLTQLEKITILRGIVAAKRLVDEIKPLYDQLNVVYDSAGGVKETVTQEDLDGYIEFAGLTKQELDDGMYVLTNVLKGSLTNSYSQLVKLAARG